jgi:hypothetical protein
MYVGEDFPQSDTAESEPYSFDFKNDLAAGEVITGVAFELTVVSGPDANPASRKDGAPAFSGTVATQRLKDLVGHTRYSLRCLATTNLNILSLHSFIQCGRV